MIQVIRRVALGSAALVATVALAACDNEVPTATGSDLFPGGEVPTTLVAEFTGADLILREDVHEGFGDPRLAPFLIVANQFDGVLDSHAIARFDTFPDSIRYTSDGTQKADSIASFAGGRILAHVDSLAVSVRTTTRLSLYELSQPWDSLTVSWDHAIDQPGQQVPWATPGASGGTMIAAQFWIPGDTAQKDTVVWELDSLTVARLQSEDHPGVMVAVDELGARLKISGLTFAADARPAAEADTLIEIRTTMDAAQTFIFSPAIPEDPSVLASGGLRGDRSVLTLDLEQEVEACPEGGGACSVVPLSDVTVNRAQLVLEPLPVAGGHRPVAPPRIVLRRVAEPELGRFAPLGNVVAADTIAPSAFAAGSDREFELDMTTSLLRYLSEKAAAERDGRTISSELSFGVLTDFEVADLGLTWFRRSPRLRVIYTLPLNPTLP